MSIDDYENIEELVKSVYKNKYNLGDKANGGFIYEINNPFYYAYAVDKRNSKYGIPSVLSEGAWIDRFGEWYLKPVYLVKLDEPKKNLTFEEFKAQCPHIKEENLEEEYEKVPEIMAFAVPEDGITLTETVDELCDRLFDENI